MMILTLDNIAYSLTNMPDEVEEHVNFAVLDNSNPQQPDFFFHPLMFLESFSSPAIVLEIGEHQLAMPIEWSVAIGDESTSCDIEIIPLTSLNNRGFTALSLNPLTGFKLEFLPVKIVNFYNDFKWHFPRLKIGNLLAVPLNEQYNPTCAFFIKDFLKPQELIKFDQLL